MVAEFKLPDLGEGVAEGEIVKWLVKEGDQVKEDQPMIEIMTDKATVQIPSPRSGVIKQLLAKEGETVKVGTSLVIFDGGEAVPQGSPEHTTPEKEAKVAPPAGKTDLGQRIVATPATRKLARDLGVSIESLKGTGSNERITDDDVRRAVVSKTSQSLSQPVQSERVQGGAGQEQRIPIHGIRKRIAEKMIKSSQGAATVTHVEEVDFTELVKLREATKQTTQGIKVTFMPFLVKAVVATLREFPYFNASIDDQKQEMILKQYYNIGFATDTSNGLIVPVIKSADKKSVFEIAKEIERLSEEARNGKIQLTDLQGGTFTITNIGTLGGVISTPIINLPEVAILGVHKIEEKPVVREGEIVIRRMAFVSLSFDHRIVDGADAARFTTKLKTYLENPALIFI
ncbi:MAG: dihydrolipoamide acetyltransferase family protein [Nitrososphaerales archaeon]